MRSPLIKILLVEDNPADARLVQLALAELTRVRFETIHVENLADARNLLSRHRFDAVLLDLNLPDSQGLDTLNRVNTMDPAIPIVVFSGHSDECLALSAVRNGAQDYLTKGHGDGHVIARVVRYAMERKRTQEALHRAREELEQRVEERTANLQALNMQLEQEIAQRHHAEEVLRKEHAFISTVLDLVGNLVIVLDHNGLIVGFNRACEEATGFTLAEVRGRTLWDTILHKEDVAPVRGVFEKLCAGRFPSEHEYHILARDNKRRLIAWSNSALVDKDGEVEFVIATGVDITDLRQAEEREKRRLLELAHVSRLSTMGEMATEIAHELNQPLAAIANYSKACMRLFKSGNWDVDDITDALQGIAGQSERAGEIIRQLRGFISKEEGRRSAVDVNDVVRAVVGLANVEARWRSVEVVSRFNESPPLVLGDKILLEQVVLNLMRNAMEAMESVGVDRRRLTICTSHNENQVAVSVRDTGPGLTPQAREKVFERFYTTKTNGMGMGLAICRSIIEAHGGQLWAAVNEPQGAVFQFVLPVEGGRAP